MELELKGNNLYRNGYLIDFKDSDEVLLLREPITYAAEDNDIYHIVNEVDRLDTIAYKYYKNLVS